MQRKNPDITTSYVHCVTQGFFFCSREVCSPGTVSLLMLTTQQVLTTGEHTHIHHNGQSTCELRQSLVLHFFSLFVFAGVQKTIERRFQPDRRVSSFSCFYIVRWRPHSGEPSVRNLCFCVFFNGSSWRLKVNDRLRIKHTVDKWADAHTLTHGVGVQCWKWRWMNLIWCEIGWADRLCLTAPLYDV